MLARGLCEYDLPARDGVSGQRGSPSAARHDTDLRERQHLHPPKGRHYLSGALEHTLSGQSGGAARHNLPIGQQARCGDKGGSADLLQRGIACLLDNGSAARGRHSGAGADTSVSQEIIPL